MVLDCLAALALAGALAGCVAPAAAVPAGESPVAAPAAVAAPAPAAEFQMLLIPLRADRALDRWHRVPDGARASFTSATALQRHDPVQILVALHGIGDLGDGTGRVELDVTLQHTDGGETVLAQAAPAWDGPLPRAGTVQLSRVPLELVIGNDQPYGQVQLTAEARDVATGRSVRAEAALNLVRWAFGNVPRDAEALTGWLLRYHDAPQPGQAVRAWLQCLSLAAEERAEWNPALLGFFAVVFGEQPRLVEHLLSHLQTRAAAIGDDEQAAARHEQQLFQAAVLFALLGTPERIDELPADAAHRARLRAAVADVTPRAPGSEPRTPQDVDWLWGEFFATGRFAPVAAIVSALREEPAAGSQPAATDADAEPPAAQTAFHAALSSLHANLPHQPLARNYLQTLWASDAISANERRWLAHLLSERERAAER